MYGEGTKENRGTRGNVVQKGGEGRRGGSGADFFEEWKALERR